MMNVNRQDRPIDCDECQQSEEPIISTDLPSLDNFHIQTCSECGVEKITCREDALVDKTSPFYSMTCKSVLHND